MILQTCRMGYHPFKREVTDRPAAPEGPHAMRITRIHTVCRFCGKTLKSRAKRMVSEGDWIRGVR